MARVVCFQQGAKGEKRVERGVVEMVYVFRAIGVQWGERVGVTRGEGGIYASGVYRRGVRPHAARGARGHWLCGQFVEARERVGVAIGVEQLEPTQQSIGSQDQ